MAILLYLDRRQYFQGSVRVYRGDAWQLTGQIVDNVGGVRLPVDLTGRSATAYFPATGADEEPIAAVAQVTNDEAGSILVPVDEAVSPLIQESPNGIQLYVVVDGPATGNPFTAQMPEPDLEIVTRSFEQF